MLKQDKGLQVDLFKGNTPERRMVPFMGMSRNRFLRHGYCLHVAPTYQGNEVMTPSHSYLLMVRLTLLETNIAPEKWWLGDDFPFGFGPIFRGDLLVAGRSYGL